MTAKKELNKTASRGIINVEDDHAPVVWGQWLLTDTNAGLAAKFECGTASSGD
jgi:hypothetical protein